MYKYESFASPNVLIYFSNSLSIKYLMRIVYVIDDRNSKMQRK